MDSSEDLSLTSFRIVFNNQLLEINYDSSFEEYKTETINSLIQKVLEKIGPQPLDTSNKNYVLLCSCGKAFDPEQLISKSKCEHYKYFDEAKNKNEKFLLIEKDKEEPKNKKDNNSELLTNYEISEILMKATGAKKIKNIKVVPEIKNINFQISENLKAKIKEFQLKKDKYNTILNHSYTPKYNEQYYQELLEMGIDSNKIKAALRITENSKEEALLLATDPNFVIGTRDYLYTDNSEILSNDEFFQKCKEEVKKEYPNIFNDDIVSRTKLIIKNVNRKKDADDSEDINESGEGYDSSSFEQEESEEDSIFMELHNSNENSSEI